MLLLEEKIQKMEQKNLGEMVFAAEVGLVGNGDGDTKQRKSKKNEPTQQKSGRRAKTSPHFDRKWS